MTKDAILKSVLKKYNRTLQETDDMVLVIRREYDEYDYGYLKHDCDSCRFYDGIGHYLAKLDKKPYDERDADCQFCHRLVALRWLLDKDDGNGRLVTIFNDIKMWEIDIIRLRHNAEENEAARPYSRYFREWHNSRANRKLKATSAFSLSDSGRDGNAGEQISHGENDGLVHDCVRGKSSSRLADTESVFDTDRRNECGMESGKRHECQPPDRRTGTDSDCLLLAQGPGHQNKNTESGRQKLMGSNSTPAKRRKPKSKVQQSDWLCLA